MLCVDTSFLFSLYLPDAHSAAAHARLLKLAQPMRLSELNEYEFTNAARLSEFRRLIPSGSADIILKAFTKDRDAGRWFPSEITASDIVAEAARISALHTTQGSHRAFDILHVAHARLSRPEHFLSFDANQLRLAKALGLRA